MRVLARVVVVGGLAGARAREQLRQGHQGEIVLPRGEAHAPYDRPPLSRQVQRGE